MHVTAMEVEGTGTGSKPKFLPPPENAAALLPSEARQLFRQNGFDGLTSGFCAGYMQANIVILPRELADDFEQFCRRNSAPLPFLYRSKPGEVGAPPLAKDSDIRTDLPRYNVIRKGTEVDGRVNLLKFTMDNMTTFYLGCSFTFDNALKQAGVEDRNNKEDKDVSMYKTTIRLYPVGIFDSEMVVSMRPVHLNLLATAIATTSQFPKAHGAPIHIGDPLRIGIANLPTPNWGDQTRFEDGEVPVFWGCGHTAAEAVAAAKPDLAFTHFAGPSSMFITDVKYQPKPIDDYPEVVPLSRSGDPFFASVIGQKAVEMFSKLEQIILDDPGNRGVAHLFVKSELLKATLALSHSNQVAITTGFPCHTDYEVKEETDGLPGALAICQALLTLGKEVTLISDSSNQALFESCVSHMVSIGAFKSQVPVVPLAKATELFDFKSARPPFDCLLAIERTGRAADGTYRTAKGRDISQYVDPIDDLFVSARANPLVTTIGIGDGGNELGMGKVIGKVKEYIPLGETIACVIPSDFLIAAGVSNWGGYAVAMGLYLASLCQLHWRYRNHGIDTESPPRIQVSEILPTAEQTISLLKHMNGLGVRDGCTGSLDQSVDGLPLEVHLKKLRQIETLLL